MIELTHLSNSDYSRYVEMKRELVRYKSQNGKASFGWARAVLSQVDKLIGREKRIELLKEVFGRVVESSRDLTDPELFALAMWGRPTKGAAGVEFSAVFIHDLTILQIAYNHQESLPGM